MSNNNERSSRAKQTAEWNLTTAYLPCPWRPIWWIAGCIWLNIFFIQWLGFGSVAIVICVLTVIWCWSRWRVYQRYQRQCWIEQFSFDNHLWQQIHPSLTSKQQQLVERGLKDFFLIHGQTNGKIAMPSQAVDALWHAFILDTVAYQAFCQHAFGRMLHHYPAYRLHEHGHEDQMRCATWQGSCQLEQLNPNTPTRLSRLFAIDILIGWPLAVAYDAQQLAEDYRRLQTSGGDGSGGDAGAGDDGGSCSGGCGGGCGG